MNKNDRIGYHTQKAETAMKEIEWLTNRIEWLDKADHKLWPDEVDALRKFHTETRKEYGERLCEATAWLEAAKKNINPVWLEIKTESLADILLGVRIPIDFLEAGEVIIYAGQKITKTMLRATAIAWANKLLEIEPSPLRNRVWNVLSK